MRGLRGLGIQGLVHPVFSAASTGGGLFSTILSYNPIAYWPLNELSGTAAINYGSLGTAANGTYSGATLAQIAAPGGGLAPLFDGVNDLVNIYSEALNANYDGKLVTALIFWKAYDASVWTSGVAGHFMRLYKDTNNYLIIRRAAANNTVEFLYKAGGTAQTLNSIAYVNSNWNMMALTVSLSADQAKWYNNDTQTGATQTGIGTIVSGLSSNDSILAASYIPTPTSLWHGYLSHAAIFSSVLTQPQIAAIYAAGGV